MSNLSILKSIVESDQEAADLEFRATMLICINQMIKEAGLTPKQVAKILEVPAPRVSELLAGKVSLMSANKLIKYLGAFGFKIDMSFKDGKLSAEVVSV